MDEAGARGQTFCLADEDDVPTRGGPCTPVPEETARHGRAAARSVSAGADNSTSSEEHAASSEEEGGPTAPPFAKASEMLLKFSDLQKSIHTQKIHVAETLQKAESFPELLETTNKLKSVALLLQFRLGGISYLKGRLRSNALHELLQDDFPNDIDGEQEEQEKKHGLGLFLGAVRREYAIILSDADEAESQLRLFLEMVAEAPATVCASTGGACAVGRASRSTPVRTNDSVVVLML